MVFFSNQEIMAIESLDFNSELRPNFDAFKFCLFWNDELPKKFTRNGYDIICDLWIARSFIYHRRLPKNEWGLNPEYYEEIWNQAINKKLKWPGFLRLELSDEDSKYLNERILEYSSGDF